MSVAMRIAKYPALPGVGIDVHTIASGSLPPVPPAPPNPVPIPNAPWFVSICQMGSPEVYGKFTRMNVMTEYMGDILAGHDWGIMQFHIPLPPILFAPNMPIVTLGSSHKYFLPSYAVQETPRGGLLNLVGASDSPVAITTPLFTNPLQDCIDGAVAPLGVDHHVPSTRWVGFGAADALAGLISMGGDAVGAAASKLLGDALGKGLSDMAGAVLGAALGAANSVVQNAVNSSLDSDAGSTAAGAVALGCTGLMGPAAIGLVAGRAADAVGNAGRGA